MSRWTPLLVAVVLEVMGTLALRAALAHPAWYVVVVVGYTGAFGALAVTLRRGMPLGVAYGTWSASGVVLVALLAALIFDESLTATMVLGIALVVGGMLCVEVGSRPAGDRVGAP